MNNTDLFPDMPKTRKYVIAENTFNGFPIAETGCSSIDDKDWRVMTNGLKADEVPEILMDAKTTAKYIQKLINYDLNKKDGLWNDI